MLCNVFSRAKKPVGNKVRKKMSRKWFKVNQNFHNKSMCGIWTSRRGSLGMWKYTVLQTLRLDHMANALSFTGSLVSAKVPSSIKALNFECTIRNDAVVVLFIATKNNTIVQKTHQKNYHVTNRKGYHNKTVVGLNLSLGAFCVDFACSPRVCICSLAFPHNPKTCI